MSGEKRLRSAGLVLEMIYKGWLPDFTSDDYNQIFEGLFERSEEDRGIDLAFESYPKPGPSRLTDAGWEDWYPTSETGQAGWYKREELSDYGKRYSLIFRHQGWELAIIMDQEGKILKREYIDDGKCHIQEVRERIAGWPKSISQTQLGGGKRTPEYLENFRDWEMGGRDWDLLQKLKERYAKRHPEDEFADERFIRTMYRYHEKSRNA